MATRKFFSGKDVLIIMPLDRDASQLKIFKIINEIAVSLGNSIYFVGGYLRDKLLGRVPGDVDLVVERPVKPIALEISRRLSGKLITLDEKRHMYRIVVPLDNHVLELDLEGIPKGGLLLDLNRRDFTINGLALPLSSYINNQALEQNLIDPLGGLADLHNGIVRANTPNAIEEDPLRALRAFRLMSRFGFTLDQVTLDLISNMRRPITVCAGERVWDELVEIFNNPSFPTIRFMESNTKLLEQIFPEIVSLKGMEQGGHHVDDAWEHCLKTLEYFEDITARKLPLSLQTKVNSYLYQNITKVRSRLPVLKLACLLHDVGKQFCREYVGNGKYTFYGHHKAGVPVAYGVSNRLKLSVRERYALVTMVVCHMEPLFLYKSAPFSPKVLRRFFRKTGLESPGVLLLSLADITSSRIASGQLNEARTYREFIFDTLNRYYNQEKTYVKPPKLVNGNDICFILNTRPSPIIGRILEELEDAQAEGIVSNRAEAEDFVRRFKDN